MGHVCNKGKLKDDEKPSIFKMVETPSITVSAKSTKYKKKMITSFIFYLKQLETKR